MADSQYMYFMCEILLWFVTQAKKEIANFFPEADFITERRRRRKEREAQRAAEAAAAEDAESKTSFFM